jgi:hypothetical protein
MKRTVIKFFFAALPVIFAASCKPTLKVSTDYDRSVNFSSYKTFSLYYLFTSRTISELNEERIWNSLKAELIKKGYVENNSNPDFVVNAVSSVKNKKYVTANSTAYGYGGIYRPYAYRGGTVMATGSTTLQASNYKEGALMIDIIDAKTEKLIWEGSGNAEFEKKPKNPNEVIQHVISKILADFPQGNATAKK